MDACRFDGCVHHHRGLGKRVRQRLWFEPHWHAAALLLCVPAQNETMSANRNVAQWVEQAAQNCSVEGSTPSIATT